MSTRPQIAPAELARMSTAWDWLHRLRQESPSQEELNQWLQWYESDERNKLAFDRARAFSQQTPCVAEGPHALSPKLWRQSQSPAARSWRRATWAGLALAAGVGALALHNVMRLHAAGEQPAAPLIVTADNSAQQPLQETALPDGSRIELASRSTVSVQYSDKARLLDLQNGVAYFNVAHNRERPFIVRAGDFYVRAVGTAFNVRHAGSRLVVTVAEGTVDVYPVKRQRDAAAAAPSDALRLRAGKEVIWDDPAGAPSVAAADPQRALAWREGRLEYFNEPLSAAIADINRYSSRRVLIGDAEAGKLLFSGAVLTDATDTWLRAVPLLLPVDLKSDENGNLVLVSRRSG